MRRLWRAGLPLAAAIGLSALAFGPATLAGAAETFYAGKTVRILVGFGTGGGYDLYARTLGRFFGRHLAGEPAVVVQNMPGAGSLKVVNYLFNAAPRDGTVMATFARGVVYEPLFGHPEGALFEAPKFNWIGSIANEVSVCAFNAPRGIATWQDMAAKKTVIGASGAGADSDVFPTVLRNLFGLPIRIVTGYPGGADLVLAMERGEIDGRCGWSWTSLLARNRDMLAGKRITVPLQIALARHEDLADVPTIMELPTDPRRAAALKLIVSRQAVARPFAAPPGVPADRVCRGAARRLRRHHGRPGFPRRDARACPRGAAGDGGRGAEPDGRHPRLAARCPRARPRASCREARSCAGSARRRRSEMMRRR